MSTNATALPSSLPEEGDRGTRHARTTAGWVAIAAAVVSVLVNFKVLSERLIPPVAVFTVLMVISLVLRFAVRRAWPYIVVAVVLGLSTATSFRFIVSSLTDPLATSHQADGLVALVAGISGTVAGLVAFIETRRKAHVPAAFRAPTGEVLALLVAGALVGATYMSAMAYRAAKAAPSSGVANGVTVAPLQAPVELTSKDARFVQHALAVKTGAGTVYVVNKDNAEHTFDIDLEGKHYSYPVPAGSTVAVVLNFATAGTHTYYCAIPGHRANGMEGRITVS